MDKTKITRTFEVTQYSEKCPHCKESIKGNSETQALWNLSVHIMSKHKDVLKKKGGAP